MSSVVILDEDQLQFSIHLVNTGEVLFIPEDQHMIAASLELDGNIELDGGLVFL